MLVYRIRRALASAAPYAVSILAAYTILFCIVAVS